MLRKASDKCRRLTDRQGAYRQCIDSVPAEGYFKSCLYDVCNNQSECPHLEAMRDECQRKGLISPDDFKRVTCKYTL